MKKLFLFLISLTLTATALSGCGFLLGNESSSVSSVENSAQTSDESKETCSVVFKQEGQNDIVKSVKSGESLTDIPTPAQKTGYTTKWSVEDFSNVTENLTVTAVATPNEYTITYDAGEGTVSKPTQKVTYDEVPSAFETPVRENYTFVCWTYNGNAILATDIWKIADNVTLVAEWKEVESHTVMFVQTGFESIIVEVAHGGTLTGDKIPQTQPVEGYTVVWEEKIPSTITSNLVINAISTPKTYTITYDAGEGEVSAKTQKVVYDTIPEAFAQATCEGYTFVCWMYNDKAVLPTDVWKIADNVTLVAKWQKVEVLVVEFVQTGYESLTFEVTKGGSLSIDDIDKPQPKTGYTVKWDLTGIDLSNITTSLVIPAIATPNEYTITYDAGEGEVNTETQIVTFDAVPGSFAIPTLDNHDFVCWTYNGTAVSPSNAWEIAKDVTLVAQWQEHQKHAVQFVQTGYTTLEYEVYTGGSLSMDDVAAPQQKEGYTVVWDLTNVDLSNITTSLVIPAIATPNEYTITYDPGEGQVTTRTQKVTYDTVPGLFAVPTRDGYKFKGWEYQGEIISAADAWKIAKDATLTAKWARICTITLNVNGGTLTGSTTITVVVGEAYTLPEPTRLYYNFSSWKNGSSKVALSGIWTLDVAEVTLAAEWIDDGWTKNY